MKTTTPMILKQCFGIDVSKDTFTVYSGVLTEDFEVKRLSSRTFKNSLIEIERFLEWSSKQQIDQEVEPLYVMEATGVYYETLAFSLVEASRQVSVLLPNKAAAFASSLEIKSKTDELDAAMLSRMGLERKLPLWNVPDLSLRELKVLTRERSQYQKDKTMANNQLHSYKSAYKANKETVSRTEKKIEFYQMMIQEIEENIEKLISKHQELAEKIKRLTTIPGIGLISAVSVVAETNGFSLVTNAKQLVSYAGLDVVHQQSGTSINKKPRISKKGNSHIRKALYMPALTASRQKHFQPFYNRVNEKKSCKKIGVIALEQKLLKLIYSLWKSGQDFEPSKE